MRCLRLGKFTFPTLVFQEIYFFLGNQTLLLILPAQVVSRSLSLAFEQMGLWFSRLLSEWMKGTHRQLLWIARGFRISPLLPNPPVQNRRRGWTSLWHRPGDYLQCFTLTLSGYVRGSGCISVAGGCCNDMANDLALPYHIHHLTWQMISSSSFNNFEIRRIKGTNLFVFYFIFSFTQLRAIKVWHNTNTGFFFFGKCL